MATCKRCGAHGLLFKVNAQGLCSKCEQFAKYEDDIARLRREADAASARAADADKLLTEAQEAAKTQALRTLEERERRLSVEIHEKTDLLQHLGASITEDSAELVAIEKKAKTAEIRIQKAAPLFQSMCHATDVFLSPDAEYRDMTPAFDACDFSSVAPVQLNCMTMKALRARYRQNEQRVRDVFTEYEKRYTTKTNAAIDRLMVLALEAELQTSCMQSNTES